VPSKRRRVSLVSRSSARRRMWRGQKFHGAPSEVLMSPTRKYSGAPPSNATNTRVSTSGMRNTSPTVPNVVIWIGPNAERKILVGASPTPRCSRAGRSAAGKLLPRKCPERSLVPTKTICSRCINLLGEKTVGRGVCRRYERQCEPALAATPRRNRSAPASWEDRDGARWKPGSTSKGERKQAAPKLSMVQLLTPLLLRP
jgi:hypothetical protein